MSRQQNNTHLTPQQQQQQQASLQCTQLSTDPFSQNYQSIYNRQDFTLTEVVDMEKQIQRLKILFEFFDIWEAGLVYREQNEEVLQEKIRLSEQISQQEEQRSFQNSGRSFSQSSYRQESLKMSESEIDAIKSKEKLLQEREKQLGEFEQDLIALRQEINKKNQIIEREFQDIYRQKQNVIEQEQYNNNNNNNNNNNHRDQTDQSYNNQQQLQLQHEDHLKEEAELESRFASINDKEIETEQEELEIQRQYSEIAESKHQIEEKKVELSQIQRDMLAKQDALKLELAEGEKKLEMVRVQVDCVQNQQSSQLYKEKLENRDRYITESDTKLAVREEKLLQEILQLKKKKKNNNNNKTLSQIQYIPLQQTKQSIDRNNTTTRSKTDHNNVPFKTQSNNPNSVQTPPNQRNHSHRKHQQEQVKDDNSELLQRDNSLSERDRSPVNHLKIKLSSRKKELSAFLSPVHQQVRKFDGCFTGASIEDLENMKEDVFVDQSYQNGFELLNSNNEQNQLLNSQNNEQNSQLQKNQLFHKSPTHSLSPVNRNFNFSNLQANQLTSSHGRSGSVQSMQEKILQQMKLNQQSLSTSKKPTKVNIQQGLTMGVSQQECKDIQSDLTNILLDAKSSQSDAKNSKSDIKNSQYDARNSQSDVKQPNQNENSVVKIRLPQQKQLGESKNKVNSMTNSQKIKNKILKFPLEQTELQSSPKEESGQQQTPDCKYHKFSFKKGDSSVMNETDNQYSKNKQNQSHSRIFSFAQVRASQEIPPGNALSSRQQINNLFNSKSNSSIQQQKNIKLPSNALESGIKKSHRDENLNPKHQNSGYKIKIPSFSNSIVNN